MGDYNADPDPDLGKITYVAYGFRLFPLTNVKADQFSTGTNLKVYKFTRRIGSHNLYVLVDPALIPGP